MTLAATAARRLVWVFLSILLLTLLLAATQLASEGFARLRQQVALLSQQQNALGRAASDEANEAAGRVQQLRQASAGAVQQRLSSIDRQLAQHAGRTPLASRPSLEVAKLALHGTLAQEVNTELRLDLWKQERAYLLRLSQALNYRDTAEQVGALERERDAAFADREAKARQNQSAQAKVSVFERGVGLIYKTPDVAAADAARAQWYEAIRRHRDLYERAARLRESLAQHPGRADPGPFSASIAEATRSVEHALANARAAVQADIETHWLARLAQTWEPHFMEALRLVASLVGLYVAWKTFFFFVVAPWVSRRPPVRIEPGNAGERRAATPEPSAVSIRVALSPGEELVIKEPYLQDSPVGVKAGTRAWLDSRYPITSLACGMFGLTAIEALESPVTITVSSTADPLDELSRIPLSPASGFVLLPSFLVAVVQSSGDPIRIRSVWRLGSLQAWLTLQLRYLVFHGSGSVVVRGCRGVKIDRPDGQRRIAKAATIGFDACLDYSNRRTETFIPYLVGTKPLLHDSFAGTGVYAYQEVPASRRAASSAEGRVMGVLDVLLKPLGI